MADSTVVDVSKMKVVELRKELKSRGLSYNGDKAELIARLQNAMSQEDSGDITLDSDDNVELDSDGVLEDEDEKSQTDILDDTAVDTLNEELALSEPAAQAQPMSETKSVRTLKRKINANDPTSEKTHESKSSDGKESSSKKVVLNRATSVITSSKPIETQPEDKLESETVPVPNNNKVKITSVIDPKSKLEMRAKRFGLPVKMSDAERKEARKQRFSQSSSSSVTNLTSSDLSDNIDKLKKRAERFGLSVSKIMSDIENKEKLEKRKAKFGTVK